MRTMQFSRWLAALGLAVLLALVPACAAPTLPVPPPTALVSAPDVDGYATITGSAQVNAHVFAFNNRTESGVIGVTDASGAYTLRILAQTGDLLSIWQMTGSSTSQINDREVP
jgi:hypothetical protein